MAVSPLHHGVSVHRGPLWDVNPPDLSEFWVTVGLGLRPMFWSWLSHSLVSYINIVRHLLRPWGRKSNNKVSVSYVSLGESC